MTPIALLHIRNDQRRVMRTYCDTLTSGRLFLLFLSLKVLRLCALERCSLGRLAISLESSSPGLFGLNGSPADRYRGGNELRSFFPSPCSSVRWFTHQALYFEWECRPLLLCYYWLRCTPILVAEKWKLETFLGTINVK